MLVKVVSYRNHYEVKCREESQKHPKSVNVIGYSIRPKILPDVAVQHALQPVPCQASPAHPSLGGRIPLEALQATMSIRSGQMASLIKTPYIVM